jgi:hypothetical protein
MNTGISLLSFLLLPLQIYCQTLSDSAHTIYIKKPSLINVDTNSVGFMYLGKVVSSGIDSGKTLYTTTDRLKLIGSTDSCSVILSFEMIIGVGNTNADVFSNDGKFNETVWSNFNMAGAGTYIYLQRLTYKDSQGKMKTLKPIKLLR